MSGETKAETYGWDTAYGIKFKLVNERIIEESSSPDKFSGIIEKSEILPIEFHVSGNFGAWQLTNGTGTDIVMTLPINGIASGAVPVKFSGNAEITVAMQFVPQEEANNMQELRLHTHSQASEDDAIKGINMNLVEGEHVEEIVGTVLKKWLEENLSEFNHVFAVVDIGEVEDVGSMKWIKPTHIGYAVICPEEYHMDDYIFGIVSMTEGRSAKKLVPQISPNIIPEGCNSGYLLSKGRFVEKFFLPGNEFLFEGSTAADFTLAEDNSRIQNKNRLKLNDMVTYDKNNNPIKLKDNYVESGCYTIEFHVNTFTINFQPLIINWMDKFDVNLFYKSEQSIYTDEQLKIRTDESKNAICNTQVVDKSAAHENGLKLMLFGLVVIAVFAMAGPIAGALAEDAVAAAEVEAEAAEVAAGGAEGGASIESSVEGVAEDEIPPEVNEAEAGEALAEVRGESQWSKFKGFFKRIKLKTFAKFFAIVGVEVGAYELGEAVEINLENMAKNSIEASPTIHTLGQSLLAPTKWSDKGSYHLVNAKLNESFQFGINIQTK